MSTNSSYQRFDFAVQRDQVGCPLRYINRLPHDGEADRWFDPAWLVAGGHQVIATLS